MIRPLPPGPTGVVPPVISVGRGMPGIQINNPVNLLPGAGNPLLFPLQQPTVVVGRPATFVAPPSRPSASQRAVAQAKLDAIKQEVEKLAQQGAKQSAVLATGSATVWHHHSLMGDPGIWL